MTLNRELIWTARAAAIAALAVALVATPATGAGSDMLAGAVAKNVLERRDTERNHAKLVGLLFPEFSGEIDSEQITTFLFKEQVRQSLNSDDGGRWLGSGVAYQIGAPLVDATHAGAVRLAQTNGFQGTVWGTSSAYAYQGEFSGIAVFPNFSWAGEYEDFRNIPGRTDQRLEIWQVTHNGTVVSVPPPSEYVPLPLYLISSSLRSTLDKEVCARPEAGGDCIPITDIGPTRIVEINAKTREVTYTSFADGRKYIAHFPAEAFVNQASVAYVSMFFNYARGHWTNTIREARQVETDPVSTTQMVHDALLYMSAALYRSGQDGSAPLKLAQREFPYSPAVSRYVVMAALLALKAGEASEVEFTNLVKSERARMGDTWFKENGLANDF
jgi:hypothetical protein